MTVPSDAGPPAPTPGESLAERVRRAGPLGAGPAWALACQLLDALGSFHARGLAHGGLEPSKIRFPGAGFDQPLTLADANGLPGQVIVFGRDIDTKRLIAPDFETFLDLFAAQLRSGTWTLGEKGWDYPPGTLPWI